MVREQLIEYGKKIVERGLVAGAGGNIGARARDGKIIWVKPSGFAMDEMKIEDLCGIDLLTGRQIIGTNKSTSESDMHLEIYKARPEVTAIFHTNPPFASGIISSETEFKPMFAEFVNDIGRVGTLPYITPTTEKLAKVVGEKAKEFDTIFMTNHGILALGLTMKQAYYQCLVVEDAAKSLMAATIVGKPKFLAQEQINEILSLEKVKHRTNMMQQEK